jgi:hypothetical protein
MQRDDEQADLMAPDADAFAANTLSAFAVGVGLVGAATVARWLAWTQTAAAVTLGAGVLGCLLLTDWAVRRGARA